MTLQSKAPSKLALKRYYRPEDVSVKHAYEAALNEVFSSDETLDVGIDDLEGRCSVLQEPDATGLSTTRCQAGSIAELQN